MLFLLPSLVHHVRDHVREGFRFHLPTLFQFIHIPVNIQMILSESLNCKTCVEKLFGKKNKFECVSIRHKQVYTTGLSTKKNEFVQYFPYINSSLKL